MKPACKYLTDFVKKDGRITAFDVDIMQVIQQAQEVAIKEMVIRCALNAKPVDENDIPTLPMSVIHDIAEKLIKEIK